MASNTAKLIRVPANGQISIGKEWAGRQIMVERLNDSELRIVSGSFTPDRKASLYSKDANEKLDIFNAWAEKHPPKRSNRKAVMDRAEKKAREKAKPKA